MVLLGVAIAMKKSDGRKRSYYREKTVVENYESSRFESKSGAWIKNTEENVIETMIRSCGISKKETALDLPTGTGRMVPILQKYFMKVVGGDYSEEMLLYARKNYILQVFRCDAFNVAIKSNSIGFVLSCRFVPHFKNLNDFLSEAARILKPNGVLVFDAYNWTPRACFSPLQSYLGGRMFIHRKSKIEKFAENVGFEIMAMKGCFVLPPYAYQFMPLPLVLFIERVAGIVMAGRTVRTYYALRKRADA